MLTCVLFRGHMCQFDMTFYLTEKSFMVPYALLVKDAKTIKMNCNCEVKHANS